MGAQHRQHFRVMTLLRDLVPKRTCSATVYDVGATVPVAVERRASVLDRSAPSRSRGLSAAQGLGFRV